MARINLQNYGLRKTYPRVRVLEVLETSSDNHLNAEEIYNLLFRQQETIALSTIYRVLTDLEDGGVVERHQFQGEAHAKYELKSKIPHDHLICKQCGKIHEFFDSELGNRQARIANEHGFQLEDSSLVLYAHCKNPKCQ